MPIILWHRASSYPQPGPPLTQLCSVPPGRRAPMKMSDAKAADPHTPWDLSLLQGPGPGHPHSVPGDSASPPSLSPQQLKEPMHCAVRVANLHRRDKGKPQETHGPGINQIYL